MDEKLEAFLAGKTGAGMGEAAPPAVAAEPMAVEPVEVETPAPEAEPAAVPEPVVSATAPEDDEDAAPTSNNGHVPVSVLQAEREKRKDWKAQAIRNAAEKAALEEQRNAGQEQLKALQAELEALKKVPAPAAVAPKPPAPPTQAQQPVAPRPMPNPQEDPAGYAVWKEERDFVRFLDQAEEALRDKEGDEAVDSAMSYWGQMVAQDPSLRERCLNDRRPYKFMWAEVKKARGAEKVGADPEAYEAKVAARLEAEIRARVEAEFAEKSAAAAAVAAAAAAAPPPIQIAPVAVRTPPNVVLPKSLANAPSAAPRSAPAWTGPTALQDIVARR